MMSQLQLLCLLLSARFTAARKSERGVSSVEWVVITALLVGIAGVVGVVLAGAIEGKANSINLGE